MGIEELSVTEPAQPQGDEDAKSRLSVLLRRHRCPSVVTVGTFDGVHRGHAALVAHARGLARARGLRTIAVTFNPRPDRVFLPEGALPDIFPISERVARLRSCGADDVVVVPFDRELAGVGYGRFAHHLVTDLGMRVLCVGEDFRLGRNREGTVSKLRSLGLEVVDVPLVLGADGRRKVSSSLIRGAIARGVSPAEARRAG